MSYSHERLGQVLLTSGAITEAELALALDRQSREGGRLGEALVAELVLTEETLALALAEQAHLEHVTLRYADVDPIAARMVDERLARSRRLIPMRVDEDGTLVVAVADPLDVEALDDVRLRTGLRVRPVVASITQVQHAIDRFIASAEALGGVTHENGVAPPTEAETSAEGTGPVARFVAQMIRQAVAEGASDIHIEPGECDVRVRYRVDGVLHETATLPKQSQAGLLSRLKVMADMNIAERRRPQDGRIAFAVDGRTYDLRVASLPTPYGENLVLRLLDRDFTLRTLSDLGMSNEHLAVLMRILARPHGALLVSGPTGSGKSTTLYALLQEIDSPERKIVTVEDPIEYRMHGITQVGVNPLVGLTFASGLRTILRADPDVVMVGEIRDPETAEIGVRAALTGHIVLTSIHTNDAPSALTRLADMGVPSYITSSAVAGVVGQRLLRKLCTDCRKPAEHDLETLVRAGFDPVRATDVRVYEAVGCDACNGTGYLGRVGVFEVMEVDGEIVRLHLSDSTSDALRKAARAAGMRPMRDDALGKVEAGLTSLDEVGRVVM